MAFTPARKACFALYRQGEWVRARLGSRQRIFCTWGAEGHTFTENEVTDGLRLPVRGTSGHPHAFTL